MIFFDGSFMDLSFRARLKRQLRAFDFFCDKMSNRIQNILYIVGRYASKVRNKLHFRIRNKSLYDQNKWRATEIYINNGACNKNSQKEDLSIDSYIKKHGGIKSQIDEKVYTSKTAYLDHVKKSDKIIKDW